MPVLRSPKLIRGGWGVRGTAGIGFGTRSREGTVRCEPMTAAMMAAGGERRVGGIQKERL